MFPQGADWTTYNTVSATTSEISAGTHVLKMEIIGNYVNVDWLEFCAGECKETQKVAEPSAIDSAKVVEEPKGGTSADDSLKTVENPKTGSVEEGLALVKMPLKGHVLSRTYVVFNISGARIGTLSLFGNNIFESMKNAGYSRGMYVVQPISGGKIQRIVLTK